VACTSMLSSCNSFNCHECVTMTELALQSSAAEGEGGDDGLWDVRRVSCGMLSWPLPWWPGYWPSVHGLTTIRGKGEHRLTCYWSLGMVITIVCNGD
jgi:hypothetical protein